MRIRITDRIAVTTLAVAMSTLASAAIADFAAAAIVPYEAESMDYGVVSTDGTLWPKLISDSAASGGKALHYGPNGSAGKTITTTALSAVTLRARGTMCNGSPVATVKLDGTRIGTVTVGSTSWSDYRLLVSRPAGTYRISVAYENNYYTRSCNRDLFLDKFTLSAADVAPPSDSEPVPASGGSVVWAGDAEHTLAAEWATGNAFDINSGSATSTLNSAWANGTRVRQVTSPVAQGLRAYAMTVRASDRDAYTSSAQRTEIGQNNAARSFSDGIERQMLQGQERWIAVQLRIPADYPAAASWNAVVQLKCEGSGNGPLSWGWANGKLRLSKSQSQTYGSVNDGPVWESPTTTVRDRWIKLLLHVKWSVNSDGFYEAFGDLADGQGFRQLKPPTSGWTLKYSSTGQPVRVGARFGIYRSAMAQDSTLYFDGFNVATTRADATQRAFGKAL